MPKRVLSVIFILSFIAAFGLTVFQISSHKLPGPTTKLPVNLTAGGSTPGGNVQGIAYRAAPGIYISGMKDSFGSGGVIPIASTDEPSVMINSYDITGSIQVTLYTANPDILTTYLIHDKDNKQTKANAIDAAALHQVTTLTEQLPANNSSGVRVTLPLEETGIWYLTVTKDNVKAGAVVIRSNTGTLVKKWDNQYLFWGQDFRTGKSVNSGTIQVIGLLNQKQVLGSVNFDGSGIAALPIYADADIALVTRGDDVSLIPINLHYLNYGYGYQSFVPKVIGEKYFIFTDRPIYKPGDTVYFKAVMRDDDDARYSIPGGQARVQIYWGWDAKNSVFDKVLPISADGTIDGSYQLANDAGTNTYELSVSLSPARPTGNSWNNTASTQTTSFDVQYYRKPDYFISVDAPKTDYVTGDPLQFTIRGEYFSGQPLNGGKVSYKVYTSDYFDYEYAADAGASLSDSYHYGWWGGHEITSQTANLDTKGEALVTLSNLPLSPSTNEVVTLEAQYTDETGNPSFARKNILLRSGEFSLYRKNYGGYSGLINTQYSLPLVLQSGSGGNVSGIPLTATLTRTTWVKTQDPKQKYPSYQEVKETLPDPIRATTDSRGEVSLTFTPTKTGSYIFSVEIHDSRGNSIIRNFYTWIRQEGEPDYQQGLQSTLTLQADQAKYNPTDTAHLAITSEIPDRDVLLTFERGRVNRYQVVHLSGKSAIVDAPLAATDMPDIFADVSGFSSATFDQAEAKLIVSTETKKLVVRLTPDRPTYGPGDTAVVNVETTDSAGNPVAANTAVWAVDKAIYELAEGNLASIFDTFWQERYNITTTDYSLEGILVQTAESGGCFSSDTPVLMGNGSLKNIGDIKVGETVLTRSGLDDPSLSAAKVLAKSVATVSGYLILNGDLKVTPEHRLWVNGSWSEAATIQIGDELVDKNNHPVMVTSVEWQLGNFSVYNLEVEKYRTYFAGGVWVHNQKGGGGGRSVFKDTAYWNANVATDNSGRAQVRFKLPDNLTTWVVASVGTSQDTKVGQTTAEIKTTKDIIVRPVLPNLLRVGDTAVLSALVQNFTDSNHPFDIDLKFAGGTVVNMLQTNVQISANSSAQVFWPVTPSVENANAAFVFSAKTSDGSKLSDSITQTIPVQSFGFTEKEVMVADAPTTWNVRLNPDDDGRKSTAVVSLAPSLLGTLATAMKYLVEYPYGCIEQTTSRFVPALVAKTYPQLFAKALADRDLNDMLKKGVGRIVGMQQGNGGWTWWFSGPSDSYVTAYVIESLVKAQSLGVAVDSTVLDRAKNYLQNDDLHAQDKTIGTPADEAISRAYGLSFFPSAPKKHLDVSDSLTPDLLALAVMVNVRGGDHNPATNGLANLQARAITQGDGVYWEAGTNDRFGSRDASTALALRALIEATGDKDLMAKATRYLSRNRHFDYWSNTYATSQVIRAITDYQSVDHGLTPNYTYTVSLAKQVIASGKVTDPAAILPDISIPVSRLSIGGSPVTITQVGDGQIYSTLVVSHFRTDKNLAESAHGLTVTRQYVNAKGENYSLGVGDTVLVKLTVSGLTAEEKYAVIADELPAGMIPVNTNLKNEQYNQNYSHYYSSFDVTDMDFTQNGVVLSLYRIGVGKRTYTYKARVVSQGSFLVPPTIAALMYAPEIYGRSKAETVTIGSQSVLQANPQNPAGTALTGSIDLVKYLLKGVAVVVVIFLTLVVVVVFRRQRRSPPPGNPPLPPDNPSPPSSPPLS